MDQGTARDLIAIVREMVEGCDELRALALCGSWARGDARPDSDIDLLALARDPAPWRNDTSWVIGLPYARARLAYRGHWIASYGIAWSAHVDLGPGVELELTFAPPSWADIDPIDPGTRAVVSGGFEIEVDKDDRLARLAEACGKTVGKG